MKQIIIFLSIILLTVSVFHVAKAENLALTLSGRILLQVESKSEVWYVYPASLQRYYIPNPSGAHNIMKYLGIGISNSDYEKYKNKAPQRLAGYIVLKVQDKGQGYYVNPLDLKMYYLGSPADAFKQLLEFGIAIKNADIEKITIANDSRFPTPAPIPKTTPVVNTAPSTNKSITTSLNTLGINGNVNIANNVLTLNWVNPSDGKYVITVWNGTTRIMYGGHENQKATLSYSQYKLSGKEILRINFSKYSASGNWLSDYANFIIKLESGAITKIYKLAPSVVDNGYYLFTSNGIDLYWTNPSKGNYSLDLRNGSKIIYYGGHESEHAGVNYKEFNLKGNEILTGHFTQYDQNRQWVKDLENFSINLSTR